MRPTTLPRILTLAALAVPASAQDLDYAGLAEAFLADHGFEDAERDTFELDELLAKGFVHARLGLYDVYLPALEATRGEAPARLERVAGALLDAQARWLDWLVPAAGRLKEPTADLELLTGWVAAWDLTALATSVGAGQRDLLAATGASPEVVQACQRFAEFMESGAALGLARIEGPREKVVLIGERARFVEFLCFAGWLYPELSDVFWHPGVATWTHFYLDEYKVLATEYAAPGSTPGEYAASFSMDYNSETGLEQQVVQLATNSLLDNYFGDRIPPAFAGGLALNLVIDVYGECATRVDGDLRERRTEAREVFVPGGLSSGGVLAKNVADSRWRENQGAERFIPLLRASQKEAARKVKERDKLRYFELLDDAKLNREVIHGPYLGSPAAGVSGPGSEFHGDHLEFLRAYRCAFLWWLQTEAGGSGKKSARTFAELLQRLAQADSSDRIEELIQETFDSALSSKELDKKALEGRFLRWLSKRRAAR